MASALYGHRIAESGSRCVSDEWRAGLRTGSRGLSLSAAHCRHRLPGRRPGVLLFGAALVITTAAALLQEMDFSVAAGKKLSLAAIEIIDLFLIGTVWDFALPNSLLPQADRVIE